jgi:hypothetical protein
MHQPVFAFVTFVQYDRTTSLYECVKAHIARFVRPCAQSDELYLYTLTASPAPASPPLDEQRQPVHKQSRCSRLSTEFPCVSSISHALAKQCSYAEVRMKIPTAVDESFSKQQGARFLR